MKFSSVCERSKHTKGENVNRSKEQRNTFFNFRIRPEEMEQIRQAAKVLLYTSCAEFIRSAIREKLKREVQK